MYEAVDCVQRFSGQSTNSGSVDVIRSKPESAAPILKLSQLLSGYGTCILFMLLWFGVV